MVGKVSKPASGDAYGGHLELLAAQLPLLGIPTHSFLATRSIALTNLAVKAGLSGDADQSRPWNCSISGPSPPRHMPEERVAVDNTFASRSQISAPSSFGADFAMRKTSIWALQRRTAGALMGSKELLMPVWNWRRILVRSPENRIAASRSLRTLVVRVRQQERHGPDRR